MKVYAKGLGEVTLAQQDFVGQGGQAAVFVQGDTAFKVFHDPAQAIPAGKIAELAAIGDPNVIRPRHLLADAKGRPVGYTMRFVRDAHVLCQLCTRTFRERQGVTPEQVFALVQRIRAGVEACHRAGVIVVDLNEMNLLVDRGFGDVFFIDVDSYQTAHFPATALMDTVRDRHAPPGAFDAATDWFAFAVVTFQLLVGIHPYKGTHPAVKTLDARMERDLSVFDPAVKVPKACYPFDVIPADWRAWYRAVFQDGLRRPPPAGGAVTTVPAPVRAVASTERLKVSELLRLDQPIRLHATGRSTTCVVTRASVYVDGRRVAPAPPGVRAVGFTPKRDEPVLAAVGPDGRFALWHLGRTRLPFALALDDVTTAGGRLYARCGAQLVEIELHEAGGAVIPAARVVGQVLEHATELFAGVAVQCLLGATYASLLPGDGTCRQVRLTELDGHRVLDARFERQVLMVLARREARTDRFVFRFAPDFTRRDVRVVADVTPAGLNFVVLDSGVCVHLTEAERIELFANRPDSSSLRVVEDEVLGGDLVLTRHEGQVAFCREAVVCGLTMS